MANNSDKNKAFMHDQCRQSCGLCTPTEDEEETCQNYLDKCTEWAEKGNKQVDNLWYVHSEYTNECALCIV
jgi:hypothetical protein